MFVIPESSNFFLLRNTPDYFIHFEQSSLDELIANENVSLNESATFVEDGGYLTYITFTASLKETYGIIKTFLINHPEFTMVDDSQIFPFSEYDTTLFYAILKKENSND